MTIIEKLSNGCLTQEQAVLYSALNVDTEDDFRSLIEKTKPHKTIIEIGTFNGVSSALLSEYSEEVLTFDIDIRPEVKQVMSFLNINNVFQNKVDNNTPEYISKILDDRNVTLAFIDGEHYFGQCSKDFEMLKRCDNIIFHDYTPEMPEVFCFCNSLRTEGYDITKIGTFFLYQRIPTIRHIPVEIPDNFEHIRNDLLGVVETGIVLKLAGETTGAIMEIGCNQGKTTHALAKKYPDRKIYAIDSHIATNLSQKSEIESLFKYCNDCPNVQCIDDNSQTLDMSCFDDIGFIFIDADHTFNGVKADFNNAINKIKKGIILLHDYTDNPTVSWNGVARFVKELSRIYEITHIDGTMMAYVRI